ncbi:hypothetical protein [Brazilian marseillevirus]|uniref:hypothetical protein n=1 Tax=Brazilian marseillevirus TaxID=1813599 RepID=UPI000783C100|nr:hypothetical protein A3303_gp451 [Brazilian marseillevirus]AMQ10959.1 hypothetical protein [Brazilian marseillevirus]
MEEFSCEACNAKFSSQACLRAHKKSKSHKNVLNPPSPQSKMFSCASCGYNTNIKCNYEAHLRSKKHSRVVGDSRTPLFVCKVCDFHGTDKTHYERHKNSRKHFVNMDGENDLQEDKLEHLAHVLSQYLKQCQSPLPSETKLPDVHFLRPRSLCCSQKNKKREFLHWMKLMLESICEKFTEVGGKCCITWLNHKYIFSRQNFLYLIVFLSDVVHRKRMAEAEEKVKKMNELGICELHKKTGKTLGCSGCSPVYRIGLDGFNPVTYVTTIEEHLSLSQEGTAASRSLCFGYWEWWKTEREREKFHETVSLGCQLIVKDFPMESSLPDMMKMSVFMSFLRKFSVFSQQKVADPESKALIFLREISRYLENIKRGTDSVGTALFMQCVFSRLEKVIEHVFCACFRLGKPSQNTKRVIELIVGRWQTE